MGLFRKTFGFSSREITRPVRQIYAGAYGGIYGMLADNSSYNSQEFKERTGMDAPALPPEPYTSGSPYAPGAEGAWDENGFPIGPMPRGEHALDWQYEGNRRTEQRRQTLWGDAHQAMRQGLNLMQSYRPGGSAALASGTIQNQAGLYASQAQSQQEPDLLIGWRDRKQQEAEAERKQTERLNRTIGLIETGVGAIAMIAGGGAAGAGLVGKGISDIANAKPGGGYDANAVAGAPGGGGGGAPGGAPGGPVGGQVGGAPMGQVTGAAPGGQPQGATGGQVGGVTIGGTGAYQGGGGSGGGGQGGPGSNPAGAARMVGPQGWPGAGGGAGAPGGAPGAAGGRPGAAGGGYQTGGGFGGSSGLPGDAPMMTFTPEEAASAAMASTPAAGTIIYPEWADDELRQESAGWFALSARQRLMEALANERFTRSAHNLQGARTR